MADTAGATRYTPSKHASDDDAVVLVELACVCGGLFRRLDPVWIVAADGAEWVAAHQGDGHEPASLSDAIDARSGTPPEAGTEGAADASDGKVRPWPFDPAAPTTTDDDTAAASTSSAAGEG